MSTLVRMRTQSQALVEVKKLDPNTALTAHALRQLVLQKKIKFVCVGNKKLINLDSLLEYLADPPQEELENKDNYGKLRRIGG